MKYQVTVREVADYTVVVAANSQEEAAELAEDLVANNISMPTGWEVTIPDRDVIRIQRVLEITPCSAEA